MKKISITIAAFFISMLVIPFTTQASMQEVSVEIVKSIRTLNIKMGDNVLKSFKISLGDSGNDRKMCRGDRKTPEGIYYITNFNPESKYHFFMGLSYPNVEDAEWGLKNNLISFSQYMAIRESIKNGVTPPQNTPLGGFVGIHGQKQFLSYEELGLQQLMDWTQGCIALSNAAIMELASYCEPGTKVVIKE